MSTMDIIIYYLQRFSWILIVLILIFGWISPILMLAAFVCMLGPIILSFYSGRAWCGNFCPRGSFSEVIFPIISPNKKIPRLFKNIWFRIIVLIIVMMLFVIGLNQPHPSLTCLGSTFIRMMAITTIVQICLALLIHPYAWCYICPMGTISYCITKNKITGSNNIKISQNCIACSNCLKNCPAQINIPLWRTIGEIKDPDCMKCKRCIISCPHKSLYFR